jgi:hypothetical protein
MILYTVAKIFSLDALIWLPDAEVYAYTSYSNIKLLAPMVFTYYLLISAGGLLKDDKINCLKCL